MYSTTYWNRLEPRPRADEIAHSLAARVRDPLWMLTRQWQLGEFQGEDAGGPAWVELATSLAPLIGWRADGNNRGGWSDIIEAPGPRGLDPYGTGIGLADITVDGISDLLVAQVETLNQEEGPQHFCRIGYNLNSDGKAQSWSNPVEVPIHPGPERAPQDINIAVADVNGNGRPDIVALLVDLDWTDFSKRKRSYIIGYNLSPSGEAESWSDLVEVPESFGSELRVVDIAVADISGDGTPNDLVTFQIDYDLPVPRASYRIGYNLGPSGEAESWSDAVEVPESFGSEPRVVGIAVADVNGNGRPDLVTFQMDYDLPVPRASYRIGYNLGPSGEAESWSDAVEVPGSFGNELRVVGIAVADISGDGTPNDLLVYALDNVSGQYRGSYRIRWNLDPNSQMIEALPVSAPLEEVLESEAYTPDLSLRVELGHTFEALLAQAFEASGALTSELAEALRGLKDAFRQSYPLPPLPEETVVAFLFSVGMEHVAALDQAGTVPETLRLKFDEHGIALAQDATVVLRESGERWVIPTAENGQVCVIKKRQNGLRVYLAALPDDDAVRFLRVCAGRAIDGVALYEAAKESLPSLPGRPTVPDPYQPAVLTTLGEFKRWVEEVFGEVGRTDSPAWSPGRLEYAVEVVAPAPDGSKSVLAGSPRLDGDFDWSAFDVRPGSEIGSGGSSGKVHTSRRHVLPSNVRFRGMPNARWWDFESGTTDFGDIKPDKRDVAKLVMMDFMLVHGNDWFLIPFEQPVGTLCRVDELVVHDVFGDLTLVKRADADTVPVEQRWTMFSTAIENEAVRVADFFFLPASASTTRHNSAPIEEVRFMRDEMANLVWAIEHVTENSLGQPWPGHERELATTATTPDEPPAAHSAPPLRYQLQTPVPAYWIPFLPIAIDQVRGDVALERGTIASAATGEAVEPAGRILQPTSPSAFRTYRIREEEVLRPCVRVSRVVCRSRWTDGSTHLWTARRKIAGAGEATSGLRFDVAESSRNT